MSLGVSLFTARGIYFQSTRKPETNSLSSKTLDPVCLESQNKTQSGRTEGAFPGLSDLVQILLQRK